MSKLDECLTNIEETSKKTVTKEQALKIMSKIEAEASSKNASKADYVGLLEDQIIWVKKLEQQQNEARLAKLNDALKVREKLSKIDTTDRYSYSRSIKAIANQIEGNIQVNTARISSDLMSNLRKEGVLDYFQQAKDPELVAKHINQLTKIDSDGVPYIPKMLVEDVPDGERSAFRVAKAIVEHRNDKWRTFKNLGVPVGYLEGRIGKTSYHSVKIAADLQGFKARVKAVVDWDKMDLGGKTQNEFIDDLATSSVSGIHDSNVADITYYEAMVDKDVVTRVTGNLAQRLGKSRKIVYKEDQWHAFQKEYGVGDMYDIIKRETAEDGRNIALLESLGSRPEQVWNSVLGKSKAATPHIVTPGSKHPVDSQATGIPHLFDHLSGKANAPADGMLARIGSSTRKYISSLHLGRVLTTSLVDPLTAAARRSYITTAKNTGEEINRFVSSMADEYAKVVGAYGDDVGKNIAAGVIEELEDMHYSLSTDTRLTDVFNSEQFEGKFNKGALNKVMNFTDAVHDQIFKFNGIEWWTNNRFASAYSGISADLAGFADKQFMELPEYAQSWFKEIGIDDIWDTIRNKVTISENGKKYITPTALDDFTIDDVIKNNPELVTERQRANYLREVKNKLKVAFAVETKKRVLTPTVSDKAFMLGGSERGSWSGEFRRFALQFKAYPIALIENLVLPALKDGKLGSIGSYFAFATPIALMITALQDIQTGKSPRTYMVNGDEDNDKAAIGNMAALVGRVMGLPVFDELAPKFFAGELKGSDAAKLLGPAISDTFGTLSNISKAISDTAEGEPDKIIGDVFPSVYNAPVIGPALQGHVLGGVFKNMIFNNLMELFNPGYEDKLRDIAENQGSEYFNVYKMMLGE
jgi:hypothetical protein